MDRISDLHDSVIDRILSHLSLPDAVRTSVLSKSWKDCWTRVRKINIDRDVIERYIEPSKMEVPHIIDSVLSRHDGPIQEFCLVDNEDKDYMDEVNRKVWESTVIQRWIQLLLDKRIQKISFIVRSLSSVHIPTRILNCSTLTHLNLCNCRLGPRYDFLNLRNLVDLRLRYVQISARLLNAVISSSASLRVLKLHFLFQDYDGEEDRPIVINAPGLTTLVLEYIDFPYILKESLYLTFFSAQIIIGMRIEGHLKTNILEYFFRIMPRVETVKLGGSTLTELAPGVIPTKLPWTLQNLKELEFRELNILSINQMARVFCLIRSSPNLKSLKINVNPYSYCSANDLAATVGFYKADENKGILSHLSKVTFSDLTGTDFEVMFISTILNCLPMLESVSISSYTSINPEPDT